MSVLILPKSTITKVIKREVVTEIPNLPCSCTSQWHKKLDFTNKIFFISMNLQNNQGKTLFPIYDFHIKKLFVSIYVN